MTERQTYKSIYWAWKSMKQRSKNPKCSAYRNYGARGINVCSEWEKFEPFLDWALSNGWQKGLDLDRIDNDGNYSPDNCRWTTRKKNLNNRRVTIFVDVDEENRSISEWAEKSGIPHGTLKSWYEKKGEKYVSARIKKALSDGYKEKDYGYGGRKKIVLLDTGELFESVADAAKSVGLASCTISNAMRDRNGRTGAGRFDWTEIG